MIRAMTNVEVKNEPTRQMQKSPPMGIPILLFKTASADHALPYACARPQYPGTGATCDGPGSDEIHGGAGNDATCDGSEDDQLWGEGGNDTIYGEGGNDTIYAGPGIDTIHGGPGTDTIDAGETDTVHDDDSSGEG